MNEKQKSITAVIIFALTAFVTIGALAQRPRKPLVGFPVGRQMSQIVPRRFITDPATIENLGFRWYISGDSNRNASVIVEFRKNGQSQWTDALPMLRVGQEVVNQV